MSALKLADTQKPGHCCEALTQARDAENVHQAERECVEFIDWLSDPMASPNYCLKIFLRIELEQ